MYEDYTSKNVIQRYSGVMLKNNNTYYSKINHMEVLGFPDYSVKINHDEKAMLIEKAERQKAPVDLKIYLTGFKSSLRSEGNFWVCEFVPTGPTQIMLSKILVYIEKNSNVLYKQILYYSAPGDVKDKRALPRLEIV